VYRGVLHFDRRLGRDLASHGTDRAHSQNRDLDLELDRRQIQYGLAVLGVVHVAQAERERAFAGAVPRVVLGSG
jgi:N-formylglutamate amidohydrolase